MKSSFLIFSILSFFGAFLVSEALPKIGILVLPNLSGITGYDVAASLDVVYLTKEWQKHLKERLKNVQDWPFNATVEIIDMKANSSYVMNAITKRIKDTTLPPVGMIAMPEDKNWADPISAFCTKKGIPFLSIGNPQTAYPRLPIYGTSFFTTASYAYEYIEVINAYIDHGVKTVVSVSQTFTFTDYNVEHCGQAGLYAASRGLTLLKEIRYAYEDFTTQDLIDIVKSLRDVHKPDAVLWCDLLMTWSAPTEEKPHILKIMKDANYLPKSLMLMNTLDAPPLEGLKLAGDTMYVIGGTIVSDKVYGSDFTEGNHDYSSMFRPSGTIASIYDQLNFGSTSTSPSSARLFYAWYRQKRNRNPDKLAVGVWAQFDIMEAAMYRASKVTANLADGVISWEEMMNALKYMQISTPYGRIEFDDHGDNIAFKSLVVQALSTTDTADIVYPASSRTAEFIYPMPTWDERVYTWKLIKDINVRIAIITASICSILIAAIIITVIVKRREPEIRMLNYSHLVLMCLCGLTVIWSLVLLWQFDNRPLQCHSFLWAVYLPASFIVHLVNMKAHRLSLFLVATATGRRPKPFSHLKVLRLTGLLLFTSIAILAIIQIVDSPKRTLIQTDKYRPKLDEHRCVIGASGTALLYLLVVGHLIVSGFCVAAVRNGMEDFRDGMIIKESFMVLYLCLGVAFIMSRLNLSSSTDYLLRTVILSLGVTLFILRFLGSRVFRFWIPEALQAKISTFYTIHVKPMMMSMNVSSVSHMSKSHLASHMAHDNDQDVLDYDAPVYVKDVPKDDNLLEMISVLKDPKRRQVFLGVSKQARTEENVDFLCKVMEFEEKCASLITEHSSNASDEIRLEALKIFDNFVQANSSDEVNVSASCRILVNKKLTDWPKQSSFITLEESKKVIETDILKRSKVFQPAFHEISIMTYQNLWNKFRVEEANYLALGQDDCVVKDF